MEEPKWWAAVEAVIREKSLLGHPFYQAWQAGRLALDDLRAYARQYYPHVAAFPRYVSAVHSATEDPAIRASLLENLIEEERGADNHPELWLRFAEGLGVARREVLGSPPIPEAAECVDTFLGLCRQGPLAGLAALYAYESQIPAVSSTKLQGLSDFYGIRDSRSRAFFDVHRDADVWHAAAEREALWARAASAGDAGTVRRAARRAAGAVWRLLDGVASGLGLGARARC